jgi:hypothetical protein
LTLRTPSWRTDTVQQKKDTDVEDDHDDARVWR